MRIILLTIFSSLLLLSCSDQVPKTKSTECDKQIIIDQDLYANGPNDKHTVKTIALNGDCLEVIYLGGCDMYEMNLVTSNNIIKTNPPIFNVRLAFKDSSTCEALRQNTINFDLSPLKEIAENGAILKIEDYDEILYAY